MKRKTKSILFCVFVLSMIILVTGCSSSSNNSKYGKEEYKCAMKSSSTRTCSYSVYANKCKCVTKK